MKTHLQRLIVTLAFLVPAVPAHAETWEYGFGSWLAHGYGYSGPSYQPAETFASLSVSTSDWLNFDFTLRAFDPAGAGTLASAFDSSAYIAKIVFNTVSGADPVSISNIQTNGFVSDVYLVASAPTLGGVTFDFSDCLGSSGPCSNSGPASGRLQSGEWVSWSTTFATLQNPLFDTPAVALHVLTTPQSGASTSAWYAPTSPVPEPETYAMLIAGLGLMAFVTRRRRRTFSAA